MLGEGRRDVGFLAGNVGSMSGFLENPTSILQTESMDYAENVGNVRFF
jgi:hypothetical protein